MKKIVFIVLLVIALFLIFSLKPKTGYWLCENNHWQKIGAPSYPKPKVSCPKKINLPETQDKCLKQNGIWKKWALAPKESCNLKTTDQGNVCFDNSECQGWCQVDKKTAKKSGQCSDRVMEFGCFEMMEKGKI
ncbi:MAG: hypothetical protein N2Z85_01665, partial [Patescibacteria group bacterium]|nr:hypothetical protein [Patescibacteria group bacterium]